MVSFMPRAKGQNKMLLAVGGGIIITMVALPSWINYWMEIHREKQLAIAATPHPDLNYAKIVYEKRKEYRRILEEDRIARGLAASLQATKDP